MPKEIKIICDCCANDLTYTSNYEDYYLVLSSSHKLPWFAQKGERSGAVTCMLIEPPIKENRYFCGLECLNKWMQ